LSAPAEVHALVVAVAAPIASTRRSSRRPILGLTPSFTCYPASDGARAMSIRPAQPWRICASVVIRALRACFSDLALCGEILRIWSVAVASSAVMLRCEQALASEPAAARRVWTSRAAANSACWADAISAQTVTAVWTSLDQSEMGPESVDAQSKARMRSATSL
jgi:hypothetical protein